MVPVAVVMSLCMGKGSNRGIKEGGGAGAGLAFSILLLATVASSGG